MRARLCVYMCVECACVRDCVCICVLQMAGLLDLPHSSLNMFLRNCTKRKEPNDKVYGHFDLFLRLVSLDCIEVV